MEALRHPDRGHVIMRADETESFARYLEGLDYATLLSTGRDWAFLADRGKGPEAEWKAQACREEWRRRNRLD